LNRNQFAVALKDRGCMQGTPRIGRVWNGIGLRADAETLYVVSKSDAESDADAPGKLAA
jgi:hypothetical protein